MSGSAEPLRVAVLASGRGSNLQALLDARGTLAVELAGVFSDRAAAGALQRARRAGIPATHVDPAAFADRAAFDAALFAEVDAVQAELIVCAGFMRIITANALAPFVGRMINIHPSLLPAYPGLRTHARALADGAAEHGASVHFVTPELDAGPVLAQARILLRADDTPETLAARVLAREHPLLVASVRLFAQRRVDWNGGALRVDGAPLARPLQLGEDDRLRPAAC